MLRRARALLVWAVFACCVIVPIWVAANSPLLAWRDPVYITAGFAGAFALALLLVQPVLAGGFLPGLTTRNSRRMHRVTGGLLVLAVLVHVLGLWITSPPDVVDALTFASPTPFSGWGVVAMWAVFVTTVLAALRQKVRFRIWRMAHAVLAIVIVAGSVVHAVQIEGTMGLVSKMILCVLVLVVTCKTLYDRKIFARRAPSR